ncbi:MAG: hypothetical protein U5L04_01720 [Trueperaceae bacterium]|nr:hypothetical protein [Trueperaceae bacterium]
MANNWLQPMYDELANVREHLSPKAAGKPANWQLVTTTGGTENNVGETTGATDTLTDFWAVEHVPTTEEEMRPGAGDSAGELAIHVEEGLLSLGDRVIRTKDSTPFRVVSLDDAGGSAFEMGQIAGLEELSD